MKPSPLLRYGVAVLAVGLALLALLIMQDWLLLHDALFLLVPLLLAAVVASAWYGGADAGLLAVALGSLVTGYFLLPLIKPFPVLSLETSLLVVFPLVALLLNWLVGTLHSSAKQRAAEAQRRYQDLLNDLHAVVWEADAQTLQCTFVSRRAEEMLGYPLERWLTEADFWSTLIHPEDREWAFALCRKAIREGTDHDIEYRAVAADGRMVWLHDIAYVTRDAEGRVRGLRGLLVDVTERKRSEEALRERERFVRQLLRNFPNGSVNVFDRDLRYLLAEGKGLEQAGLSPEMLVGKTLEELLPKESADFVKPYYQRAFAGENVEFELPLGGYVLKIRAAPLNEEDDEVRTILAVAQNVTEHKQAEEALRESEERFRSLVQHSSDIITVVDADGTVLYVSPTVERVLGYKPGERVGKHAFDLVHPEDLEQVRKTFTEALAKPGPTPLAELRYRHADGSWHYLEAHGNNLLEDPVTRGIVINSRDVSERKQAERILQESEERYRAVVEQAAESIFLIDIETRGIVETNAAFRDLLGYSPEETAGLTLYDIVAHDRKSIDDNIHLTLEQKSYFIGERRHRRKDGSLLHVEVNVSVIPCGGKEALCVVAHDITERKRAEEKRQRSLDMLSALYETGQILSSTLKREQIGSKLFEMVQRVCNVSTAVFNLRDERGRLYVWHAGGPESLWHSARGTPAAQAARRAVLETKESRVFQLQPSGPDTVPLVGLCLPLRVRDQLIGVLEVYGTEDLTEKETAQSLDSLATQVASALENARLYEELAEREHQLRDLVGRVLLAQEEERHRVAYDIHDGLAQLAVAAHQHLQAFGRYYPPDSFRGREELDRALDLVQQTVREARYIISDLRPPALDDFGLVAAIQQQVEELRAEDCRISYAQTLGDERLPVEVETALFRVAQEALTNVRKHAHSARVQISLERLEGAIRLQVRDWGRGIQPAGMTSGCGRDERVGLSSMRERVALLGGDFEIRSERGVGTSIAAQIPLPEGDTHRAE